MTRRLILVLLIALGAIPIAARADEPIHLKFASIGGPGNPWYKGLEDWVARINQQSGGLLDVKLYPGGTIADFRTMYDRVLNGVADIGFGNLGLVADQYPKSQVSTLPFLTTRSAVSSVATWRLYSQGLFAGEYTRVKPIALFGFGVSTLHFVRPIKTADDLKGLKILVTSRTGGELVDLLGAAPITSNSGELYGSLNRGLAQGVASTLSGTQVFKTSEVAKYHVDVPLGDSFAYIFLNKTSYDRLPESAKQLIERESGESFSLQMGKIADEEDDRVKALYRAGKDQVIEDLAPAEMDRMRQLLNPFVDKWVQQTPNGAAVLAAYRDSLKAIGAGK